LLLCLADGPEPLPAYIFCLAQHPEGNTFATSCSDGVLRVWSLEDTTLSLLHELGLHQTLGTACAFSTDGKMLFSASKNGDFVLMVSALALSSWMQALIITSSGYMVEWYIL
jgi:WD40 repeat protein